MMRTRLLSTTALCSALLLGTLGAQEPQPQPEPTAVLIARWIEDLGGPEANSAADRLRKLYPKSRAALVRSLRDKEADRRRWCARVLGETRDRRNETILRRAAIQDSSAPVRIISIQALAAYPNYSVVPLLKECLATEVHVPNQQTILRMIGMRDGKEAIGAILDAIEWRFDERMRQIAYRWLRKLTNLNLPDDLAMWREWWGRYSSQKRG